LTELVAAVEQFDGSYKLNL